MCYNVYNNQYIMYDDTKTKVIEQIYLVPGIHKRKLAKQLKLGMPSIDHALKKIEVLLKKQMSGNQIRYYLDYSKKALAPLLWGVEFSRLMKLPSKIRISVQDFLEELEDKPLIALIFGSYARGDYSKGSDIDILLVFQNLQRGKEKEIENNAKRISMRTNTTISPVYLDYKLFRESFHNSTKAFFKNIKENKIILIGVEYWRQIENEKA